MFLSIAAYPMPEAAKLTGSWLLDAAVWVFFCAYVFGLLIIAAHCLLDVGRRKTRNR